MGNGPPQEMGGRLGEFYCLSSIVHEAHITFSLQVNVLSTFLLAALLAPLLAKSAKVPVVGGADLKPHLVVVASDRRSSSHCLCYLSNHYADSPSSRSNPRQEQA